MRGCDVPRLPLRCGLFHKTHFMRFSFWFLCLFIWKLLDYEAKAADQVPLLMRMKKDELALEKAIMSGDTDLGKQ